jgi:hypothetical protein
MEAAIYTGDTKADDPLAAVLPIEVLLMDLIEIPGNPNVYLLQTMPTGDDYCRMTEEAGGQIWATDYNATYVKNTRDVRRYILASAWPGLSDSRVAVSSLCGYDLADVKYTYAAMARQVSQWLGVDQRPDPIPPDYLRKWHYQHCEPCRLPVGYILDMRYAYWQVACRAPSLLCRVDYEKEQIIWHVMSKQAQDRWERCKIALETYKRLRLAIIGVNSTGLAVNGSGVRYFAGGVQKPMPGSAPTCFRNLALLTVRCAYELTQQAREEVNAWYANADCILSETDQCPYWNSCGVVYRAKAQGPVEIYGLGQWSVGDDSTIPYQWKKAREQKGYAAAINAPTYGYHIDRPVYHEQLYNL